MKHKVSYAHESEPEGIRFIQYTDDHLPPWAVNVVYEEDEEKDLTKEES